MRDQATTLDVDVDDPRVANFPRCSGIASKPCTTLIRRAGLRPVGYAAQSCGHHCRHAGGREDGQT